MAVPIGIFPILRGTSFHRIKQSATMQTMARSAIELINDTVRHSTGKNSRSLARLLLLVVAVVIFSTSYFIVAVKWTHIPILRKKAIELNYIHNKDGKK